MCVRVCVCACVCALLGDNYNQSGEEEAGIPLCQHLLRKLISVILILLSIIIVITIIIISGSSIMAESVTPT